MFSLRSLLYALFCMFSFFEHQQRTTYTPLQLAKLAGPTPAYIYTTLR